MISDKKRKAIKHADVPLLKRAAILGNWSLGSMEGSAVMDRPGEICDLLPVPITSVIISNTARRRLI